MRYLVATDGSTQSKDAVRYAAKHAAAFEATLEIAHVVTPETELVDGEIVMEGHETAAKTGRQTLDSAVELAEETVGEQEIDIETQLLTGRPADALSDRANAAPVDAVFVGHRGLSEKREAVVGSVAKSIVDKATVPVTVVR